MKFRDGQKVEVKRGDAWWPATVIFVWRGIDLDTRQRVFHYDVAGDADWGMKRVPQNELRRPNRARGRRRVLRSHSVKMERFT